MNVEERFDMERDDRRHESTLARHAGRRKFACCSQCGSADGMQSMHRDELRRFITPLSSAVTEILIGLYSAPGNDEYLFYPCHRCNRDRIIPAGFQLMSLPDALYWINYDTSMQPDYGVLTVEEPVSQIRDSRDSAGLEG